MSNFIRIAWHPVERVARAAHWMDNHFGQHRYGIWFPGDPEDEIYRPEEVDIPIDLVLSPVSHAALNSCVDSESPPAPDAIPAKAT